MKEQSIKEMIDHSTKAWHLAMDLFETLKKSEVMAEVMAEGKDNQYVLIDIMMAIAEFTHEVLTAMESASKGNEDFHEFYINVILKLMQNPDLELPAFIKSTKEEFTSSTAN